MGTVVVGIGIPGSGKTHTLKPLAVDTGALYLSSNDIRQELNGDANDQGNMKQVWDLIFREAVATLGRGQGVVIDSTCAKQDDRLLLVHHCQAYASSVVGLWFIAPFEVCQQRNLNRERVVPLHAMKRMHRYLTNRPPTEAEGFNELLRIDTSQ